MLKYVDTEVVFAEVPDEITLAINISNCPCHCKGCHSPYLAEDIGEILNEQSLDSLIKQNKGITCIAFMGGDGDIPSLYTLAKWARNNTNLKVAWYSGRSLRNDVDLGNFDYIKTGMYLEEYGPLNKRGTNQILFKIHDYKLEDITSKFWKE